MNEENRIAFVIMQIGNEDMDMIYSEIFVPAIKSAKLEPKRIDKDNQGKLLKTEIVEYIEKADIIIADLTNERPNCYLEIGYTMGLDKYNQLIFTVREDHFIDSPNHKVDGPKIHFDVAGYDILSWHMDKLEEFKTKLSERIQRRLLVINPSVNKENKQLWDNQWLTLQRDYVKSELEKRHYSRYFEALISPVNFYFNILQSELLEIASNSQIDTFGWPIGIVFKNQPELRPIPKVDGILSEIDGATVNACYDYSYFKKNGQIFLAKTLFEENQHKGKILIEVRIKRLTELLIYILRYYTGCKLPKTELINIKLKYSGIRDNTLMFANTGFIFRLLPISRENECEIDFTTTLSEIETKLSEKVYELLFNLFILFDFQEVKFDFVKNIVDTFIIETNARR